MDIPVTLLTVFLVYVFVKYLNELAEHLGNTSTGLPSLLKIPIAIVAGIGAVMLMAQTDFAGQQEFFGRTLNIMSGGTQVVVGIVLGAAAVGLDTTFKTVNNIGENVNDNVVLDPPAPPQ